MKREDLPIGFAMALAMNPEAMERFSNMTEAQKQEIIAGTHSLNSKEEMHRYVNGLASNNPL